MTGYAISAKIETSSNICTNKKKVLKTFQKSLKNRKTLKTINY